MTINPETLISSRIILEPVSLSGLGDFHEYSICEEFYQYLEFMPFETISDSEKYLNKLIDRSRSLSQQYWFVRLEKEDKVIGTFGVHSLNEDRRSVEIGYGISPYYWGKGYFKESANLVMHYLFNTLRLHRIVARTYANNMASVIALEKLGFSREGILRDYYKDTNGDRFNAILLSKLSSD